jgi:hypothetical protein
MFNAELNVKYDLVLLKKRSNFFSECAVPDWIRSEGSELCQRCEAKLKCDLGLYYCEVCSRCKVCRRIRIVSKWTKDCSKCRHDKRISKQLKILHESPGKYDIQVTRKVQREASYIFLKEDIWSKMDKLEKLKCSQNYTLRRYAVNHPYVNVGPRCRLKTLYEALMKVDVDFSKINPDYTKLAKKIGYNSR